MKKIGIMCRKSFLYLKRSSPTILSCAAVIGAVAASVMAVKATPKAMKILEEAEKDKGEELTKREIVIAAAPVYIPSLSIGLASVMCILGANVLNKRQQAALAGAYALMENSYKEYRNKVKELFGKDGDEKVRSAVAKDRYEAGDIDLSFGDGKELFYEEISGEFFERTRDEIVSAEYHFNRNFILRGYATLNEFYEFLGLPKTEEGEMLGWSLDVGFAFYGYSWVNFEHTPATMEDGLTAIIISMPFPPTADYLEDALS